MTNLLYSTFDLTRELKSTFKAGTILVINQMIVFAKYKFRYFQSLSEFLVLSHPHIPFLLVPQPIKLKNI